MVSRAEVTTRYVKACVKASKKGSGRILDQVVEVTAAHHVTTPGADWTGAGCPVKVCAPSLVCCRADVTALLNDWCRGRRQSVDTSGQFPEEPGPPRGAARNVLVVRLTCPPVVVRWGRPNRHECVMLA